MTKEREHDGKGTSENNGGKLLASDTDKSSTGKSGLDPDLIKKGLDADFVYYDEA